MRQSAIVLAISCGLGLLASCSSIKDLAEVYAGESVTTIFHQAEINLAKGNYHSAIRRYEALDTLYPFSQYSEQALLESIYAYYQSSDYALTAATAARFIRTYPTSAHVDYAYYLKGVAEMLEDRSWAQRYLPLDVATRDPGTMYQAYDTFSTLVKNYPNSRYAPHAQQRLIYLRNLFAAGELHVAQYYLSHHAYVGAANRASNIMQYAQNTPAVEGALAIMVESYRALNQPQEADKALQVLRLNFPQSQWLKKLKN